jgi:hypothetical protein
MHGGYNLLFTLPDAYNLYHTLFDLVVVLYDTIVSDRGTLLYVRVLLQTVSTPPSYVHHCVPVEHVDVFVHLAGALCGAVLAAGCTRTEPGDVLCCKGLKHYCLLF